jgi:hypothetical protein
LVVEGAVLVLPLHTMLENLEHQVVVERKLLLVLVVQR